MFPKEATMYRIISVKMLVIAVDVLLGTTSADTFWDLVLYVINRLRSLVISNMGET